MLDISRLRQDIRTTSEELKKLKTEIRQPGWNITYQQYRDLVIKKEAATVLCMLRAFSRGRCHIKPMRKDLIEKAARNWYQYELKEEVKIAA